MEENSIVEDEPKEVTFQDIVDNDPGPLSITISASRVTNKASIAISPINDESDVDALFELLKVAKKFLKKQVKENQAKEEAQG